MLPRPLDPAVSMYPHSNLLTIPMHMSAPRISEIPLKHTDIVEHQLQIRRALAAEHVALTMSPRLPLYLPAQPQTTHLIHPFNSIKHLPLSEGYRQERRLMEKHFMAPVRQLPYTVPYPFPLPSPNLTR